MPTNSIALRPAAALVCLLMTNPLPVPAAQPSAGTHSTWPQEYTVQRDDAAGQLTLSTPYYTVQHDLKRGGAIASIRLTHGRATNLLVQPVAARITDETGAGFTDLNDPQARVSHRREGAKEIVTVESRLRDEPGRDANVSLRTVFEYRWGYVKVRREFRAGSDAVRVREVCPLFTVLAPNLSEYGYREGLIEEEGAAPFAFGSNRWGKLRRGHPSDPPVAMTHLPRSVLLADPGVEGLEWFAGSDLGPWEHSLEGRRGQGRCVLEATQNPPGVALTLATHHSPTNASALPEILALESHLGWPLLEGRASRPWLHTSFNRNRGDWVSSDEIRRWAERGIQTVHCHNDGDYYDDGLFWRDGSYPPYPDMDKYDRVIADCHRAGIRVATYFSNKELHPSTDEFRQQGQTWGRMDSQGRLQHNIYRGTNEFGAQMCLRSGWLEFLKFSIDRVLDHHRLDGVYFDWNVALHCRNPRHEGKPADATAAGHWDMDELLDLMEWTRRRVGPDGIVIVHNTTTPVLAAENFADYVVANEWGYGAWKDQGPSLEELPLEWSLVGARARGVISYGQLNAQSPRRLHRVFALEALLSGVTPWPASPEAFEFVSLLKHLGDLTTYRFADWRNTAVRLEGTRCGAAVYSRPGEAYLLLGNLQPEPQTVRCSVDPAKFPHPLASPTAVVVLGTEPGSGSDAPPTEPAKLDFPRLLGAGVELTLPGDGVVTLQVR